MNKTESSGPLLEHGWRYFELHANQRMTVFNYFLLLSTAVAAGLGGTLQGSKRFSLLGILLGVLLTLVSFVFWKLDQRVSFLIKHAEAALAELEKGISAESARLFLLEPQRTIAAAKTTSWWTRHWTYGRAFRLVFTVMGLLGIAGAVLSGLRFRGVISW